MKHATFFNPDSKILIEPNGTVAQHNPSERRQHWTDPQGQRNTFQSPSLVGSVAQKKKGWQPVGTCYFGLKKRKKGRRMTPCNSAGTCQQTSFVFLQVPPASGCLPSAIPELSSDSKLRHNLLWPRESPISHSPQDQKLYTTLKSHSFCTRCSCGLPLPACTFSTYHSSTLLKRVRQ